MTGKGLNEISKYEFVYIRSRQKKMNGKQRNGIEERKKKLVRYFLCYGIEAFTLTCHEVSAADKKYNSIDCPGRKASKK